MKKIFLLLSIFYLLAGIPSAWTQSPVIDRATLDAEVKSLQRQIDFQKRDLEIQIKEASTKPIWAVVGYGALIVIAIAAGPIAVAIRSRADKAKLEALVQTKLGDEMQRTFPPMAKKLMEEYLNKEVPAKVSSLLAVAKSHETSTALVQTTSILVVAETLDMADARAAFLRERGFLDVRTSLPLPYDELPSHRICFIEHPEQEDAYHNLSNKYIQAVISKVANTVDRGMFFLVPFNYRGLDFALISRKNFANSEAQIEGNLMRLIHQLESISPKS